MEPIDSDFVSVTNVLYHTSVHVLTEPVNSLEQFANLGLVYLTEVSDCINTGESKLLMGSI